MFWKHAGIFVVSPTPVYLKTPVYPWKLWDTINRSIALWLLALAPKFNYFLLFDLFRDWQSALQFVFCFGLPQSFPFFSFYKKVVTSHFLYMRLIIFHTLAKADDGQEKSNEDAPENNSQYTTVYVGNLAPEVRDLLMKHSNLPSVCFICMSNTSFEIWSIKLFQSFPAVLSFSKH